MPSVGFLGNVPESQTSETSPESEAANQLFCVDLTCAVRIKRMKKSSKSDYVFVERGLIAAGQQIKLHRLDGVVDSMSSWVKVIATTDNWAANDDRS